MTPFEQLVEDAIGTLPVRFRRRMRNLVVIVEREPPTPGLLGLYEGRPLIERSIAEPFAWPDRITIFEGPHKRMARDRRHLARLVRDTVWHEVAHYFGLDEAEVLRAERKRMLGRGQRRAGGPDRRE